MEVFVMTSIAHECVALRFSKCLLHIYSSIHVVLCGTFVSVKKKTQRLKILRTNLISQVWTAIL